jgi:FtsP/CotA-like multicopper oxidase with cupredoxin domain
VNETSIERHEESDYNQLNDRVTHVPRRTFLKLGAVGAAAVAVGTTSSLIVPELRRKGLLSPNGVFEASSQALAAKVYLEVFPTSPLILNPFSDPFNKPMAASPVPYGDWTNWSQPPGPGLGQQNSYGYTSANGPDDNNTHQRWKGYDDDPVPLVYQIKTVVDTHSFTTSQVLPINNNGQPVKSFDSSGKVYPAGTIRTLPPSTIYGFNGTFPGPMINAEYGKPVIVRFENHLDENIKQLDVQDFGAPDRSLLIHLHNGHTAPESDGNPHWAMTKGPHHHGFRMGDWVDQLYLNWPAGSDDTEKQSFFWFHDHRMDHTGSNVYKGMVGLFPIYDPKGGLDMGDETQGYRLPGVRTNRNDGAFDVDYDVPFALYDCRLDDGTTVHQDIHDTQGEFANAGNPRTHPEWWGKTFYKHFPNHGFVGDIFTVNGVAYPVMEVERRKYRFRFLDASVSRIYELKLMSSSTPPKPARDLGLIGTELQGQYRLPDGQQCMQFLQIATDGGLIPDPIWRDSFELWPAKRREFIVDFSKYQDGHHTSIGDVIYLTNVMKMPDGRMWTNSSRFSPDPAFKVPMVKFVIVDKTNGKDPVDNSLIPTKLRDLPAIPANWKDYMNNRSIFEVERGSLGGEIEWLINGVQFNPFEVATSLRNPGGKTPLASQKQGSFNLWEIRNGGGGWVHPFHLHMEEHRTMFRNGKPQPPATAGHPDDISKEDLAALDPGESVIVWRGFRDFVGPYVAHCHNLAHEDHAMMFGWEITP